MSVTGEVSGPYDRGLQEVVTAAMDDLAVRLRVSSQETEVVEARAVVWPDAGLGCPQAGMRYKQVPVDGALIRLAVGGSVYEYHSGGGRGPFLCRREGRPPG